MSRTLYIVRHGNTFAKGEEPRRVGAPTDIPLVDTGHAQAAALGEWFVANDIRFARALSGPLVRTRQTAAAILIRVADAPSLEIVDWLREIDHGPDENQLEPAIVARIGAAAIEAWDRDATPPPDWQVDAPARIAAWRAFFDAADTGDVLLVTSNGAARFALLARPDLAAGVLGGMKVRTGSVSTIAQGPDGALSVVAWDVKPTS